MANNNYMEQFPADPHRDVSRTPRRQLVGFPRWGPAQRAPLPPPPPPQLAFPPTPPGFFTPPTTSRPPFSPTQPPLRSPPPAASQSTPTSSPTLPTNPQMFPSRLTPARPFDLRPDPSWQPNDEFYDQTKVGGLELARTIRASQFTSSYNIEGCDPLLIPLCSLLYAGVNNHALRRIAAGRETYIVPTSDLPTCVFFTHLNRELKQRNIDIDRAAQTFCRTKGEVLDRSDACKRAAQEIASIIQQWVPIGTTDVTAQQTISELQARLAAAEAKIAVGPTSPARPGPASTPTRSSPIEASLRGQPPPPEATFDPASLLVVQPSSTTDQWFIDNPVPKLTQLQLNTWLKNIKMDPTKRKVLEKNLVRAEDWWNQQPDTAYRTIERAAVNLGVPAQAIPRSNQKDTEWHVLIKILTTAIFMAN